MIARMIKFYFIPQVGKHTEHTIPPFPQLAASSFFLLTWLFIFVTLVPISQELELVIQRLKWH
jgi:hypothetical protein